MSTGRGCSATRGLPASAPVTRDATRRLLRVEAVRAGRPGFRPRVLAYFAAVVVWSAVMLCSTVSSIGVQIHPVGSKVCFTFGLVGIASAYGLARSVNTAGASFSVIFWFFNLFFMSIAPLAQYLTDSWAFPVRASTILQANTCVLLYVGVFACAYTGGWRRARNQSARSEGRARVRIAARTLVFMVLISSLIAAAFAIRGGFRWDNSVVSEAMGGHEAGALAQVVDYFIRPFVFFVFLFTFLHWKRHQERNILLHGMLAISGSAAVLLNSPLGHSRFYVFATYLGLMMVTWPPNAKRATWYLIVLLLGLYGASIIGSVRDTLIPPTSGEPAEGAPLSVLLCTANFDAYEMLAYAVDYVNEESVTAGRQFLGALLFWVPRSLWEDKPIGTGAFLISEYISRTNKIWYTNFSEPLIGEFFINFWVPGVIVFTAILGVVCGQSDQRYRAYVRSDDWGSVAGDERALPADYSTYAVLYPTLVGLFLFVLRGDMLSGTAYVSGFFCAFTAVNRLVTRRVKPSRIAAEPHTSRSNGSADESCTPASMG
jgi:hypothetical protein